MLQPEMETERMSQTLNKQMHREIESAGRVSDRRKLYIEERERYKRRWNSDPV